MASCQLEKEAIAREGNFKICKRDVRALLTSLSVLKEGVLAVKLIFIPFYPVFPLLFFLLKTHVSYFNFSRRSYVKATSNAYWGIGSYLKRKIGRLNPFPSKALVPIAAWPKAI